MSDVCLNYCRRRGASSVNEIHARRSVGLENFDVLLSGFSRLFQYKWFWTLGNRLLPPDAGQIWFLDTLALKGRINLGFERIDGCFGQASSFS